mgnify:FL=1
MKEIAVLRAENICCCFDIVAEVYVVEHREVADELMSDELMLVWCIFAVSARQSPHLAASQKFGSDY